MPSVADGTGASDFHVPTCDVCVSLRLETTFRAAEQLDNNIKATAAAPEVRMLRFNVAPFRSGRAVRGHEADRHEAIQSSGAAWFGLGAEGPSTSPRGASAEVSLVC
jgi:hypothetical protein